MALPESFSSHAQRIETVLSECLPPAITPPTRLHEAMRYVVLGGGKRVRPFLVYATGSAFGGSLRDLDAAAAAVELIHAYSLVHDDLPAMDDDDLRRGQPTCHRAYDEATAILVGDGLQALAFELLAFGTPATLPPEQRLRMLQVLAHAAGSLGMVGGQAIDLYATGSALTLPQLEDMHRRKTGALITAAVQLGALASPRIRDFELDALDRYARAIGLAFQVRDDLLDIEASTSDLGKPQGSDERQGKATYPRLLGLEGARATLATLHATALTALQELTTPTTELRTLADYIVARKQ
ncbi:MAG TPA: (2E,6E)-farnesyl diphosphate synthase [Gammaproteobacteria bacterium]|nr:(2E,6E)-farnesyl diphosphate synthase [Gammaproteobacteria bacterium]